MKRLFNNVILIIGLNFLNQCVEGDVKCVCTTRACKRQQMKTCTAKYMCYAQSMAEEIADIGLDIVRGCIDDRTPLLCDNKIPKHIDGAWPVLYCCSEDWCNRRVIPQIPQWLLDREEKKRQSTTTTPILKKSSKYYDNVKNNPYVEDIYVRKPSDSRQTSAHELNPIYIGIPIAGVCILLASVIFAIFLLKRNSSSRDNQTNFYHHPPTTAPSTGGGSHCCSGDVNRSSATGRDDLATKYALGSERSSPTSESKLLMNV